MFAQDNFRGENTEGCRQSGRQCIKHLCAVGVCLGWLVCIQVGLRNVLLDVASFIYVRQPVRANRYSVADYASIGWMYFGSLNRLCADVPCLRSFTTIENLLLVKNFSCRHCSSFSDAILFLMPLLFPCGRDAPRVWEPWPYQAVDSLCELRRSVWSCSRRKRQASQMRLQVAVLCPSYIFALNSIVPHQFDGPMV